MKKIILGTTLLAILSLAGCRQAEKSEVHHSSTSSEVQSSSSSPATSVSSNSSLKESAMSSTATSNSVAIFTETSEEPAPVEVNSEVAPPIVTMNLTQIRTGDYSSIAGNWVNGVGSSIHITGDTLIVSPLYPENVSVTLTGQLLDIPEKNEADGSVIMENAYGLMMPAYTKKMEPEENPGYFSLYSRMPSATLYISFLPKNVPGEIQGADSTQERIVAIGTQNTATSVPAQYVYYKVQ